MQPSPETTNSEGYREKRDLMVSSQIEARGVLDDEVARAMRKIPRHEFVPARLKPLAYSDRPLDLESGQTISQPYMVAFVCEAARLTKQSRCLEIGTGSGYQAAVLSQICAQVYSIEIIKALGQKAEKTLNELGIDNVEVKIGDGFDGWPEKAPFDAIMLSASPKEIPPPLIAQLKIGGRIIAPVGTSQQILICLTKLASGNRIEELFPVLYVPMTGKAQH